MVERIVRSKKPETPEVTPIDSRSSTPGGVSSSDNEDLGVPQPPNRKIYEPGQDAKSKGERILKHEDIQYLATNFPSIRAAQEEHLKTISPSTLQILQKHFEALKGAVPAGEDLHVSRGELDAEYAQHLYKLVAARDLNELAQKCQSMKPWWPFGKTAQLHRELRRNIEIRRSEKFENNLQKLDRHLNALAKEYPEHKKTIDQFKQEFAKNKPDLSELYKLRNIITAPLNPIETKLFNFLIEITHTNLNSERLDNLARTPKPWWPWGAKARAHAELIKQVLIQKIRQEEFQTSKQKLSSLLAIKPEQLPQDIQEALQVFRTDPTLRTQLNAVIESIQQKESVNEIFLKLAGLQSSLADKREFEPAKMLNTFFTGLVGRTHVTTGMPNLLDTVSHGLVPDVPDLSAGSQKRYEDNKAAFNAQTKHSKPIQKAQKFVLEQFKLEDSYWEERHWPGLANYCGWKTDSTPTRDKRAILKGERCLGMMQTPPSPTRIRLGKVPLDFTALGEVDHAQGIEMMQALQQAASSESSRKELQNLEVKISGLSPEDNVIFCLIAEHFLRDYHLQLQTMHTQLMDQSASQDNPETNVCTDRPVVDWKEKARALKKTALEKATQEYNQLNSRTKTPGSAKAKRAFTAELLKAAQTRDRLIQELKDGS